MEAIKVFVTRLGVAISETKKLWALICMVSMTLFLLVACYPTSASSLTRVTKVKSSQPPVISELIANAQFVRPEGKTRINCIAQDPNGDRLTYSWSASGGAISGSGARITWVAPKTTGVYSITVTVSDGKSGEATKETTVNVPVDTNSPPYIKEVLTVPASHDVGDDKTVTLTCIAVDPDGYDIVDYDWDVTGGTIEGSGPTVVWKLPVVPTKTPQTVMLRVTDSR